MQDSTERVCDLMAYHKELEQEELFLTALLSKIDKQIHALQVEQLQLLNAGENSINLNVQNKEGNKSPESKNKSSVEDGQELDLRPIKKLDVSEFEEEEEEDDVEEEEEPLPENSADFDYL